METIKVLSITQPWATLIALGAKRIETRSWTTRYRGMLAIHASKTIPKWAREEVANDHAFRDALRKGGYRGDTQDLPIGAIVAVATLVGVVPITRRYGIVDPSIYAWTGPDGREYRFEVTPQEHNFGAYADGRFAWLLDEVIALDEPIQNIRGALGLWEFDRSRIPAHALAGYWRSR